MSKLVSVSTNKYLFPGFMANITRHCTHCALVAWECSCTCSYNTCYKVGSIFFTLRVNCKVQQMGRDADKMNYDLGVAEIIIGR